MRHNSRSLPPEVAAFFERERKEQKNNNNLAQARGNIRDTTLIALRVMDKIQQRGNQLDVAEEMGEELVSSSQLFLWQTRPWWKRILCCECLPQWWWCSNKTEKQHESDDEEKNYKIEFV